jgi:hypothetical protein
MKCGCGRIDNAVRMRGVFRLGVKSERFLRPLIGVVVAYAVAVQSLLIAVGGFSLPTHASEGAPTIELCLHGADGAPLLPAGNPDHSACTHCIFCFAGLHHAVIKASPAVFHRVAVTIVVPLTADTHGLPPSPPYSIGSPRGPPRWRALSVDTHTAEGSFSFHDGGR